ncbi:hypothetical protein BKA65DRAFT_527651 [Rhexocercosporidium sp. MPI-PUGE-AT-0058]|nr:hypothetical protein BKA65DRAFT_527651 [Rhexocercosporidium sp. MPI-PUGE-AT-0058]
MFSLSLISTAAAAGISLFVMLFTKRAGIVAIFCISVLSKEIPIDEQRSAERYRSGKVHTAIMAAKMRVWKDASEAGLMESSQYSALQYTACKNGISEAIPGDARNTFRCRNADLYHFLSHAELNSTGSGSSSWGWTSDTGREFVAIGQEDGTAFVEITSAGKMHYLGRLPQYSVPIIWREIRAYKNYMIIGSEAERHGIQIFDMKKLLTINPTTPRNFDAVKDLTGHFNALPAGRSHNVVVNEELNYAVAVGAQPRNSSCLAGLIFIDLTDPSKPTTPGCAAQDGYVHDAQCLVYRGPDKKYQGRDICYGYNEDSLTIYDVTSKVNTSVISRTSYEGASYTHQGLVLDILNQEFLLLDDELDEQKAAGPAVDAPKQTGFYKSSVRSIDHNQYVYDGYSYQSNYAAGLRVLDISSIPSDPTGANVCEAGFFDIHPEDDLLPGGGNTTFVGTWSMYPYFRSGYIFINTIERGAFVVKMTGKDCIDKKAGTARRV